MSLVEGLVHKAAMCGNLETMQILLDEECQKQFTAHALLTEQFRHDTPFAYACRYLHYDLVCKSFRSLCFFPSVPNKKDRMTLL